jgi:hypothetical protein
VPEEPKPPSLLRSPVENSLIVIFLVQRRTVRAECQEACMGLAKKEAERLYWLERQAMAILLKTGAVSECDVHDGVFIDNEDPDAVEEAYALAARKVQSGETKATLAEYRAAIDEALATALDHCPYCPGPDRE